jgi:hypothetical protein
MIPTTKELVPSTINRQISRVAACTLLSGLGVAIHNRADLLQLPSIDSEQRNESGHAYTSGPEPKRRLPRSLWLRMIPWYGSLVAVAMGFFALLFLLLIKAPCSPQSRRCALVGSR